MNNKDRWSQLSLKEKAQLLGIYASKGYTDLASIVAHYNAAGGSLDKPPYKELYPAFEYGKGRKMLDKVGSPVVVTTGYQKLPDIPELLAEMVYKRNGLVPTASIVLDGDLGRDAPLWSLPEAVITADRVKAKGGHLFDGDSEPTGYLGNPDDPPKTSYPLFQLKPAISTADNTYVRIAPTPIEINAASKAYEAEKLQQAMEEASKRQPIIKADTRSPMQRMTEQNAAIGQEVKQKAQEQVDASIFQSASPAKIDVDTYMAGQSSVPLAMAFAANPVGTALSLLGGHGVDKATEAWSDGRYTGWGNMMSDTFGGSEGLWSLTNPGYLAAPAVRGGIRLARNLPETLSVARTNLANRGTGVRQLYPWQGTPEGEVVNLKPLSEDVTAHNWQALPQGKSKPLMLTEGRLSQIEKEYATEVAKASPDMAKLQQLSDEHYKLKTKDNQAVDESGNPVELYHSGQTVPQFTSFNTNYEGRGDSYIYAASNPLASKTYIRNDSAGLFEGNVGKLYDAELELLKFESLNEESIKKLQNLGERDGRLTREEKKWVKEQRPIIDKFNRLSKARDDAQRAYMDDPYGGLDEYTHKLYAYEPEYLGVIDGKRSGSFNIDLGVPDKLRHAYSKELQRLYSLGYSPTDSFLYGDSSPKNYVDWLLKKNSKLGLYSTRDIERAAKSEGVRAFKVKNIYDVAEQPMGKYKREDYFSDIYAFKDPRMLKSTAPITYDDAGNIIPLSKRHDFTVNDIRYSITDAKPVTNVPFSQFEIDFATALNESDRLYDNIVRKRINNREITSNYTDLSLQNPATYSDARLNSWTLSDNLPDDVGGRTYSIPQNINGKNVLMEFPNRTYDKEKLLDHINHERRHVIQNEHAGYGKIPTSSIANKEGLTIKERSLLDSAYPTNAKVGTDGKELSKKAHLLDEKSATNTELYLKIASKYNIKDNEALIRKIDDITSNELLEMLSETNAYGKRYVESINQFSKNKEKSIRNIRTALKYVPVLIPYILKDNEQK